jgi:hypothetical protein
VTRPACSDLDRWIPADARLAAILETRNVIADGFGGSVGVKRKGLASKVGCYELHHACAVALAPKPASLAADPCSRKVVCLNRYQVPVRSAGAGKLIRAWPAALRQALFSQKLHVDEALVLGGFYSHCNNYFHYWCDVMADLWFIRQSFSGAGDPYFLLPYQALPWQKSLLALCGLPEDRVIALADMAVLHASRLRVAVRSRGGRVNPPWLVQAMRELSGFDPGIVPPHRKIYISRLGSKRRSISNEKAVIDALAQRGFEIVDCGALSVPEQQGLFREARLIIAPHGAALVNLAWCHSSAHVVEFLPDRQANPCFRDLAQMRGMGYHAIVCAQDGKAGNVIEIGFDVPLERLLQSLAHLGLV